MGYGYKGINNSDDGIVTVMNYDEFANIQDKMEQRRNSRRAKERKNRATYFHRQRILGAVVGIIGIFFLILGCYIASNVMQIFGAAVGLVGLFILVTKQMIMVDSYFLECQDRMYNDR